MPANRTKWVFLFLAFWLLFSSFRWNIFRIEDKQVTQNLGVDDAFILPAMELYAGGPSLQRNFGEIQVSVSQRTVPYFMQVGLQRIIYSWLSPHNKAGVDRSIPYIRAMIEIALALTLVTFIAVIRFEFGFLCAGITTTLLALSNWLIIFAPDLFWVSATFFAPFVLAWTLGDPLRPVNQQRLLAILFALFCLVKCLCGFDYTTNIFAAVAVPFIYYGLRRGVPFRKTAMRILQYGAISIAAFSVAIGLQVVQYAFVQRDSRDNVMSFFNEARRRTLSNEEGFSNRYETTVLSTFHRVIHFSQTNDPWIEHYLVPLRPVLRYVRYLTMGAVTMPLPRLSVPVPIGLFVIGFLMIFWFRRKRLYSVITSGAADRSTAWMWSTLAALAISHLWVVAANGHMTHTFFNAIVFYIPFLPMVYVMLGIAITAMLRRIDTQLKLRNSIGSSSYLPF
jgi:hypothetical protein